MTYLLQIVLDRDIKTHVGSLGDLHFKKGTYFYVGSAKRGLKARVKRHLSGEKSMFWHIDYLLSSKKAKIKNIWINAEQKECQTAREFQERGCDFINKFGSSDCQCNSHLFLVRENISRTEGFLKRRSFKNADKSSF